MMVFLPPTTLGLHDVSETFHGIQNAFLGNFLLISDTSGRKNATFMLNNWASFVLQLRIIQVFF